MACIDQHWLGHMHMSLDGKFSLSIRVTSLKNCQNTLVTFEQWYGQLRFRYTNNIDLVT